MPYLLIRQRFADDTQWRVAFDRLAEVRARSGMDTLLVSRMSGVGINYPRPRGSHRLVGKCAPDVPLAGSGSPSAHVVVR